MQHICGTAIRTSAPVMSIVPSIALASSSAQLKQFACSSQCLVFHPEEELRLPWDGETNDGVRGTGERTGEEQGWTDANNKT